MPLKGQCVSAYISSAADWPLEISGDFLIELLYEWANNLCHIKINRKSCSELTYLSI